MDRVPLKETEWDIEAGMHSGGVDSDIEHGMHESDDVLDEHEDPLFDLYNDDLEPDAGPTSAAGECLGVECLGCPECDGSYDQSEGMYGSDEREWDDSNMGGKDRFGESTVKQLDLSLLHERAGFDQLAQQIRKTLQDTANFFSDATTAIKKKHPEWKDVLQSLSVAESAVDDVIATVGKHG